MGQMMGHLSALDEMRPSPFAHNDASALCPLGNGTKESERAWPALAGAGGASGVLCDLI